MIDLRSDTVTTPPPKCSRPCAQRELGDDFRDGDPTVRELEALAAPARGKEAGLFMPSGTLGNLVALMAHTGRGGEVLLEENAHILNSEMGAIAQVAGCSIARSAAAAAPWTRHAGPDDQRADEAQQAGNRADRDGNDPQRRRRHRAAARSHGKSPRARPAVRHSGAHRWRAAVQRRGRARGAGRAHHAPHRQRRLLRLKGSERADRLAALRHERVHRSARPFRRMLGGNLRQAGGLAAAGIVALETMVDRLAEDHRTARQLAEGLHRIAPGLVDPASIETNIVRVDTTVSGWPSDTWSAALARRDVRVAPGGPMQLRSSPTGKSRLRISKRRCRRSRAVARGSRAADARAG